MRHLAKRSLKHLFLVTNLAKRSLRHLFLSRTYQNTNKFNNFPPFLKAVAPKICLNFAVLHRK